MQVKEEVLGSAGSSQTIAMPYHILESYLFVQSGCTEQAYTLECKVFAKVNQVLPISFNFHVGSHSRGVYSGHTLGVSVITDSLAQW